MESSEALKIIQALVDGINPCTGELLPDSNFLQKPSVLRALFVAARALEQLEEKEQRTQRLPESTGKSWDKSEDQALCSAFDSGLGIIQLAQKHQRTVGAIQSRLQKLGKISIQTHR